MKKGTAKSQAMKLFIASKTSAVVLVVAVLIFPAIVFATHHCSAPTIYTSAISNKSIPSTTLQKKDSKQKVGESKIETPGITGTDSITYKLGSKCNHEVSRVPVRTVHLVEPTPQIVLAGTLRYEDDFVDDIPFDTVHQNDPALWEGDSYTKQHGVDGQGYTTVEIKQDEGQDEMRSFFSQRITVPPKDEIIMDGTAPEGSSAICRDNTYSFSEHHQGTCSHHSGVRQWVQT